MRLFTCPHCSMTTGGTHELGCPYYTPMSVYVSGNSTPPDTGFTNGLLARIAELEAENKRLRADVAGEHAALLMACSHLEAATNALHAQTQRAEQAEAELATYKTIHAEDGQVLDHLHEVLEAAEAELAALKGRRCETCEYWGTNGPWDFCADMRPDFACNRWATRAEEGGRDERPARDE